MDYENRKGGVGSGGQLGRNYFAPFFSLNKAILRETLKSIVVLFTQLSSTGCMGTSVQHEVQPGCWHPGVLS